VLAGSLRNRLAITRSTRRSRLVGRVPAGHVTTVIAEAPA
jgi:hypothetical protein